MSTPSLCHWCPFSGEIFFPGPPSVSIPLLSHQFAVLIISSISFLPCFPRNQRSLLVLAKWCYKHRRKWQNYRKKINHYPKSRKNLHFQSQNSSDVPLTANGITGSRSAYRSQFSPNSNCAHSLRLLLAPSSGASAENPAACRMTHILLRLL